MATLTTIYWICFGFGLVYLLIAGAMGAISGGLDSDHGDLDIDHDTDFDLDHDSGIDFHVEGHSIDFDFDGSVDVGGGGDIDADHGADFSPDTDHDMDHGGDHSDDFGHVVGGVVDFPAFSLVSPLAVAGFLMAFGGAGLLAITKNLSLWLGLGAALAGGALMSTLLWLVIGKFFYSMQGTSEARQFDMIGLEAEVLTPMEEDLCGEISYVLGGMRYTAPAKLTRDGHANKMEKVRIKEMRDNIVYVEQKKKLLN